MQIPASHGNQTRVPALDRFPVPEEMGAFASSLRSLTNYEVWERAESAMRQLTPDPDSPAQEWLRVEALLDELRWRLSGLEGPGSPAPQLAVKVSGDRDG